MESNLPELTANYLSGQLPTRRGKQAYREGSSEFGAVRPHRTSSNHCDEGGCRHTGKDRVSSGRFEYTEPPRITVTKG